MVLIWDQINDVFKDILEHQKATNMFTDLIDHGDTFFDCKILSASNANKKTYTNFGITSIEIEMNPINVFTQQEIYYLVKYESSIYQPKIQNNDNLAEYSLDLCKILNYSISEYYFYTKSNWKMFPIWTISELFLNYV